MMSAEENVIILIADSDSSARELFKSVLELVGFKVTVATGLQNLGALPLERVEVAVIDFQHAEAIYVAKRLRELRPLMHILLLSVYLPDLSERLAVEGLDNCEYLVKPISPGDLIDHLTHVFNTRRESHAELSVDLSLNQIDLTLYKALLAHPELLKTLDWRRFEELLADILESMDYQIELMRGTKDGGIDIFAIKGGGAFGDHRYLVQAKRWERKVGIEPVQRLLFQHSHHKATKSCLATTATFTRGAWSLAREYQWHLELRDYNGLRDWLEKAIAKRLGSS